MTALDKSTIWIRINFVNSEFKDCPFDKYKVSYNEVMEYFKFESPENYPSPSGYLRTKKNPIDRFKQFFNTNFSDQTQIFINKEDAIFPFDETKDFCAYSLFEIKASTLDLLRVISGDYEIDQFIVSITNANRGYEDSEFTFVQVYP